MTAKRAMITGASEGIGLAIARKLAAQGYGVTGVARSGDRLRSAMAGLDGPGPHDALVADLTDETGRRDVLGAMADRHYDVLVNNAGIGCAGAFAGSDLAQQLAVLRLNCEALVALSYGWLRTARAGDALMNISSVLAFAPMPGLSVYSASKAFVTSFSDSLWFEQRPRGVFVTALHPGATATDFQVHAGGKADALPPAMAQTADQVADAAVAALRARRDPAAISGGRNRMVGGLSRILPRKALIGLMGRAARDLNRLQ